MRSDSEIERDVKDELEWDPDLDATDIAVSVKQGVVSLTGFVKSYTDALKRLAEVDANRIEVDANGSEVVLKGTVRSWAEREEAERAAWAAPGVTKVEDRIVVSP
jgi:osmotically-inducible protein OsmY